MPVTPHHTTPQRTTLTLAAAVACAFCSALPAPLLAQSSVTIGGVIDVWAGQERTDSAAGAHSSTALLGRSGMTTSHWSISGKEDLGGGWRTEFLLSSYMRPDIGGAGRSDTDGYFTRAANVGLGHPDAGTLLVGRIGTPLIGALFATNAFIDSTTFSSAFANHWAGAVAGDTGMSNAVRYTSPLWGGWRAHAMATFGDERPKGQPDRSRGRDFEARMEYIRGPAYATVSHRNHNLSTNEDGRKQKIWLAGGAWDFSSVKVYAQYMLVDDQYRQRAQNIDRDGYTLGARVPRGAGVFMLSHSRSSIDDMDAATPSKRRTTSLGYDHTLSRRSDVYVNWLQSELQSPRGTRLRRVGIGLRHRF